MQESGDDLVVATPERVAFQYPLAGLGSRFLAQLLDWLVILALEFAIGLGVFALWSITNDSRLAWLIVLILSFLLVTGYFLVSEALWSGQTIGKMALHLRVVGDEGQPLTISQAAIRNLVRIVDFLPLYYGLGVIAMFVNQRGKRLGDFAAGTIVVRERERVSLRQLTRSAHYAQTSTPAATAPPTLTLEPALRSLVVAYASRRSKLAPGRRAAIAQSAEEALARALPGVVAERGTLAALDELADAEVPPGP